MCIIIHKPKGIILPPIEVLNRAARFNPDGFGLMTADGFVYKTLDANEFIEKANEICKKEIDAALHFRFATHGSVKKSNCHPFSANGISMMHNGVLPFASENDKTDSEIFLQKNAKELAETFAENVELCPPCLRDFTNTNRFCFLADGNFYLFGSTWFYKDGCYYSNSRIFNTQKLNF